MNPPRVRAVPLADLAPGAWASRADVQTLLPGFDRPGAGARPAALPVWNERTGDLVRGRELVRERIEGGASSYASAFVVDLSPPEADALRIALAHEDAAGGS